MAAVCEDFFTGDDLEAILDIIEGDFVEESEEFNADIGALLSDIDPESVAVNFPCEHRDKTCKTKRGLTRHVNARHPEVNVENRTPSAVKSPEEKLHPLYFKKFIQNGASKLALDECYSEKFRKEFSSYVVTYDDALFSYQFVRDLIGCFNGDLEKFYPTFYKCVSSDENAFKNLSRRSSRILGYEVANHVVAHLTGSFVKESGSGVELRPNVSFTEKESDIIKYLSGYVFGTIYRRIRLSKSAQSMLGFQSLSILLAGKVSSDESSDSNKFLCAKDRGGLWTVSSDVYEIFSQVEANFRQSTASFHRKIDSKKMITELLEKPSVLFYYNKIRGQADEKVSKEIAFNLLEHLITLYIRVRTFSLVKDKRELHSIWSKKKKKRSLRTEIKKSSSNLDQGH